MKEEFSGAKERTPGIISSKGPSKRLGLLSGLSLTLKVSTNTSTSRSPRLISSSRLKEMTWTGIHKLITRLPFWLGLEISGPSDLRSATKRLLAFMRKILSSVSWPSWDTLSSWRSTKPHQDEAMHIILKPDSSFPILWLEASKISKSQQQGP